MGMVDAEQCPVMVKGMLFGCHIVEGRDFESPCLVSLFGVVYNEDVDDQTGAVPFFPAEEEPAALIGEGVECVIYQ
jgi:hypothetical protein